MQLRYETFYEHAILLTCYLKALFTQHFQKLIGMKMLRGDHAKTV